MASLNKLVIVLGDQLNESSEALEDFDPRNDRVWMAETDEEATHVWCHKFRLVAFFSPMRHFRDLQRDMGRQVEYHQLQPEPISAKQSNFASLLKSDLKRLKPRQCVLIEPGDYRVKEQIANCVKASGCTLEILEDRAFFCSHDRFKHWTSGRKQWILDSFYREMRREHDVLMSDGQPEGGAWNYDAENRQAFGKGGPQQLTYPPRFAHDEITREVIEMVERRFAQHPGTATEFDLPVTRVDALTLFDDFLIHRLEHFGKYQDAMWKGEVELYHSRISHALNIGLLRPREVVAGAVAQYESGRVSLASCEGFVRQILGWREYVRGVYWEKMPEYLNNNYLETDPGQDVPRSFWDGNTEMACVHDAMQSVLRFAYAHHIQRLMVLGLFAQLIGVVPRKFHDWHMAMYADAIDWVSAANTIGMSQYGDGGLMSTKPYVASGSYIDRMGNYCKSCRFDPKQATGDKACPFTTLYWDFLDRHQDRLAGNQRMKLQLRNLERKSDAEIEAIRQQASDLRKRLS